MNFNWNEALELLERTPNTLEHLVIGLSDGWLQSNEGENTWTVKEVVDHLVQCEKTNWIPRILSIVEDENLNPFPSFDRFAHLTTPTASIDESIMLLKQLRQENMSLLKNLQPTIQLSKKGLHPEFGEVTLEQLLSTWVVHDLTHISQIVRVMAKRYSNDVGPWQAYLSILKK